MCTSIAIWNCSCSLCSCSASDSELAFTMLAFSMDSPLRIQPNTQSSRKTQYNNASRYTFLKNNTVFDGCCYNECVYKVIQNNRNRREVGLKHKGEELIALYMLYCHVAIGLINNLALSILSSSLFPVQALSIFIFTAAAAS